MAVAKGRHSEYSEILLIFIHSSAGWYNNEQTTPKTKKRLAESRRSALHFAEITAMALHWMFFSIH